MEGYLQKMSLPSHSNVTVVGEKMQRCYGWLIHRPLTRRNIHIQIGYRKTVYGICYPWGKLDPAHPALKTRAKKNRRKIARIYTSSLQCELLACCIRDDVKRSTGAWHATRMSGRPEGARHSRRRERTRVYAYEYIIFIYVFIRVCA